jgi:hypothetical protein
MEVPVMRTRLAALAALCVIPIVGCSGSSPDPLVTTNDCVGTVVTVIGDMPTSCNVTPPQRLDVNGVTIAACVMMGGTVVTVDLPMDGLVNCEGVDY